jgi:hypothetical protein
LTTRPSPDARADACAAAQSGVVTRPQAIAAGLTARQVQSRLESGRWITIVPGVYRSAGAPVDWRQRVWAAVLAGPTGTVASHASAAALHGLLPPRGRPHVIVPTTASGRSGIAVVHRIDLHPRDRVLVSGIPRTTVTRALVDCAGVVDFDALCALVDTAFCEGASHRRVVLAAIDRAQAGGGKKGVVALRRALEAWTPGIVAGSPAEMRLLRRIAEHGIEPPERQVEVYDTDDRLVGRLDLGWPHRRVGIEYDSDLHHNPRHWVRDEARMAAYAAAGWQVHRVDKHDLRAGSTRLSRLLDRIVTHLAA